MGNYLPNSGQEGAELSQAQLDIWRSRWPNYVGSKMTDFVYQSGRADSDSIGCTHCGELWQDTGDVGDGFPNFFAASMDALQKLTLAWYDKEGPSGFTLHSGDRNTARFHVNCGHRCPIHNDSRIVCGAVNSWHKLKIAFDISGFPLNKKRAFEDLAAKYFRKVLRNYSTFVHVNI